MGEIHIDKIVPGNWFDIDFSKCDAGSPMPDGGWGVTVKSINRRDADVRMLLEDDKIGPVIAGAEAALKAEDCYVKPKDKLLTKTWGTSGLFLMIALKDGAPIGVNVYEKRLYLLKEKNGQYGSSMELSCTVEKFMVDADRVVTVCLGLVEGEWSAWAEGLIYRVTAAILGPTGRYLLCQSPRGVAIFGPGVRAAMEHVVKRDPDHAYAFLLKLKTGQQYDIPIATDAFKKAHSEATKAGQAILDDEAMERWAESWFRPGNEYAFQPGPHTCGFGMVGPEIAKPVKVRMSKSHEAAAYLDALLAKGCESRLTFMEADDEGETWRVVGRHRTISAGWRGANLFDVVSVPHGEESWMPAVEIHEKLLIQSYTADKLKKELKKRKVADSVVGRYAKKAALKRCLYEVMGHATVDLTAGDDDSGDDD